MLGAGKIEKKILKFSMRKWRGGGRGGARGEKERRERDQGERGEKQKGDMVSCRESEKSMQERGADSLTRPQRERREREKEEKRERETHTQHIP